MGSNACLFSNTLYLWFEYIVSVFLHFRIYMFVMNENATVYAELFFLFFFFFFLSFFLCYCCCLFVCLLLICIVLFSLIFLKPLNFLTTSTAITHFDAIVFPHDSRIFVHLALLSIRG